MVHIKISSQTNAIVVDINRVLSDVSSNPIGTNLNFLLDDEKIGASSEELKLGSLRYPMGEIADYYLFDRYNTAKPKVSIIDPDLWFSDFFDTDGSWKNPMSFDRFVNICRSFNAEPFVVIGIDALAYTGDRPHAEHEEILNSAVNWVEYANLFKKYKIKYWEIGNENDLSDANIKWTAENYARTVVKFARAMKQVDSSIKIGANGMTNSTWWNKVMPIVKNDIDFLVTHQYSYMQSYEEWAVNDWDYIYNLEIASQAIDKYKPKLKINVTEASSFNPSTSHYNNIWKMLHNFEMLCNILKVKKVDYLHFWTSRWFTADPYTIDASVFNSEYELMPMAYPLKILGDFLQQKMVFSTQQKGKLRSWASYNPGNNSLSLFLLNKDLYSQKIDVEIKNYKPELDSNSWVLTGNSPYDTNPIWQQANYPKTKNNRFGLKLEPLSITVVAFTK